MADILMVAIIFGGSYILLVGWQFFTRPRNMPGGMTRKRER